MSCFIMKDNVLSSVANEVIKYVTSDSTSFLFHEVRKKLDRILNWDYKNGSKRLFDEMAKLNRRAYYYRYGEESGRGYYDKHHPLTKIQLIKQLNCFLYQCCENNLNKTDQLYQCIDEFRKELEHDYLVHLKEYDEAPWG